MMYDNCTLERMTFINDFFCFILLVVLLCVAAYLITVILVLIYSIYRKIRYKEMINFSKILKFPIFGISNLIVVCIGSLF